MTFLFSITHAPDGPTGRFRIWELSFGTRRRPRWRWRRDDWPALGEPR